jgi:hypothetical protein
MPRKVVAAPVFDEATSAHITLTIEPRPRRQATGSSAPVNVLPRIPRIARLMALAIKFQELVDRGEVRDFADIARLGYVTRARVTQIMNLLLLAPDIQEALLALDDATATRVGLTGKHLRAVTKRALWAEQRRAWDKLQVA